MSRNWFSVLSLALAACTGDIEAPLGAGGSGSDHGPGPTGAGGDQPPAPAGAPHVRSAVRRLTRSEVRNTVVDLLGVDPDRDMDGWPSDTAPFDNIYGLQSPSTALVQATKVMAEAAAQAVVSSPPLLARVVGCGASDPACVSRFIKTFGRRALRRPLGAGEIAGLEKVVAGQSFSDAVAMIIQMLLQDLELSYRIECGGCMTGGQPPTADRFRLSSFEVASRLSFLLWGSTPDDELLDLAEHDGLQTPAGIRAAAARLLASAQTRKRVSRFHAMWLGYEWIPLPLAQMRAETDHLLERVIFEKRSTWLDLFRSRETYLDAALARHYGDGITAPASGSGWVGYGLSARQGILSHGAFLSTRNGPGDTSPTLRGKHVRLELLCEDIPPPNAELLKKLNGGKPVDTSKPPEPKPGECRLGTYTNTYLGNPGCESCHKLMDRIGLGLDNYDMTGKYRKTELGRPTCAIPGHGQLVLEEAGVSVTKTFTGPAQLGQLLLGTEETRAKLGRCLVTQFFRFAAGQQRENDEEKMLIAALDQELEAGGLDFQDLITGYVTAPAFGQRLVDRP